MEMSCAVHVTGGFLVKTHTPLRREPDLSRT
jgi:hypothetical protein